MYNEIFQRSDKSIKRTALDKAQDALSRQDFPALAAASEELSSLVGNQSYLREPQIIIADILATDPKFVPQAIAAYESVVLSDKLANSAIEDLRNADIQAPLKSVELPDELTQRAVTGIENNAPLLQDPSARAQVYLFAAECTVSIEQEKRDMRGYVEAVLALPDILVRLSKFKHAAFQAWPGSEGQKYAVVGFVITAEALEPQARTKALEDALFLAGLGSPGNLLEKAAKDGLSRLKGNREPLFSLAADIGDAAQSFDSFGEEKSVEPLKAPKNIGQEIIKNLLAHKISQKESKIYPSPKIPARNEAERFVMMHDILKMC